MNSNEHYLGAIVCEHVANGTADICYANRTEPVAGEDSGWQFLCCVTETLTTAVIWSVEEVLAMEPSLRPWINSKVGTSIIRQDDSRDWRRLPIQE